MMSSLHSSSEARIASSRAFERLHPKVQEWIWDQRWDQLRPTQVQAIEAILDSQDDVIISAATASGKTEAAWLPICSSLAFDAEAGQSQSGVKSLYISPLKALINDQYERLQVLGGYIGQPVYRRHGDVTGADRKAINEKPDGLLLTTPESLEALFVLQGTRIPAIFRGLRYIVIDELHSFIGIERGAQLQSLLHRLELAIRRRVPRIGLSATLADPGIAADFLRPGDGGNVTIVGGTSTDTAELQLILRGYVSTRQKASASKRSAIEDEDEEANDTAWQRSIAENIFKHMRGNDNLVFANSRTNVEIYADLLTRMSDEYRVPNEFFPHHGSLSKEYREDVEKKLKSSESHATAICTSTLEIGIDIGSADAVGQIGAPASVSALRQRVGRSGRRGKPAILRMYVTEDELTERSSIADQLRVQTFQAVAVIELLLEKWYEPPNIANLHFSTLVQQILSVIAQHGGASASQIYSALCSHGPFSRVTREQFLALLRELGVRDVLVQAADGLLLHGKEGEKIVNHYTFYTAFQTSQEFRLVASGRTLGSIPIDFAIEVGSLLIFAGRRWRILSIDEDACVIEVTRSSGGVPPRFIGGGGMVSDGVRRKMRSLYLDSAVPAYLSASAQLLLSEGRTAFKRLRLDQSPIVSQNGSTLLFLWKGDLVINTLAVMFRRFGFEIASQGAILECGDVPFDRVIGVLRSLASSSPPDGADLAKSVALKDEEKYDYLLGEALLNDAYATRNLDISGTLGAIRELLSEASRLLPPSQT